MKKNIVFIFAALFSLAACQVKEDVLPVAAGGDSISEPFFPGLVTVEFDDETVALIEADLAGTETKSATLQDRLQDLNIEYLERVFPNAGPYEGRTRRSGLHRFYSVRFSESMPVTKAMDELQDVPGIVSVTPSRPIKKRAVFDDPKFSYQWHYVNSTYQKADINVKEVWENYTVGNSNVVVCVVDEPVDPTHEDLMDNLWKDGSNHTGYNYVKNNYTLTIKSRDSGHGTHVAGTIAAVNNNGIGLCGVAGGDKKAGIQGVRIMSHAIFSGDDVASDSNTARALKEGADRGAVISQNSWGLYADSNEDGKVSSSELAAYKKITIDDDPTTKAAIDYFIQYAGCDDNGNQLPDSPMKGGLVFFAAGNENIDWDVYSTYEPVIAVGAFRENGGKASYSNYGSWVDIAAPGGEGEKSNNSIWSTLPKLLESSGYGGVSWAGTSMACPHASGVAALIVSYYGGYGFTNERAKEILFAGLGDTIGGKSPVGKKLDALASFQYGGFVNQDPLYISVTSKTVHAHETVTLPVRVQSSDPSATVECTPGSSALVFNAAENSFTINGNGAPAGTYKAVFVLHQQNADDFSLEFEYTLLPNHAPKPLKTMDNLLVEALDVTSFVSVPSDLSTLFTDEDGEILDIKVENSRPNVATLTRLSTRFSFRSNSFGITTVTITATDGLGEQARISFEVVVKDQQKKGITEVFPETVTDEVFVWPASESSQTYSVKVFSESGALVFEADAEGSLSHAFKIATKDLAPGVYTVMITSPDGTVQKTEFVKI